MKGPTFRSLPAPGPFTRRQFLARNAMGGGSVALAWMLKEERLRASGAAGGSYSGIRC